MDLIEMYNQYKEQKKQSKKSQEYIVPTNCQQSSAPTELSNNDSEKPTPPVTSHQQPSPTQQRQQVVDSDWAEATKRAVNLLFQFEKTSYQERRTALECIESTKVQSKYQAPWNQIVRIWREYSKTRKIDTETLPNPDGVKYAKRPYPITGSAGVQDLIKEIIKNL